MNLFTPLEYLKIDVASNYGLDKKTWDTRIQWVDDNEHLFEAVVAKAEDKLYSVHPLMKEASSPALFYAGIKAYLAAKEGKVIHHPISLDATASGAQILAILSNCEKSAKLCNVIDTGDREDLYTNIYAKMCERTGTSANIEQPDVKQAIMTWLYGSTAEPKKAFGKGALLDCFYKTMFEDAAGIAQLNMDILSLWDADAYSNDWVLPDNFHVHVPVIGDQALMCNFLNEPHIIMRKVNMPQDKGLSIGANLVHSVDGMIVREMVRRCSFDMDHYVEIAEIIMQSSYARGNNIRTDRDNDILVQTLWNHYEKSGFLSARILNSLDHFNIGLVDYSVILKLLKSMPEKPFHVISVHDCFRVHPNYGNDLRRQYNQILHEIADSKMLQALVDQISKTPIDVTLEGSIAADVLNANYALS